MKRNLVTFRSSLRLRSHTHLCLMIFVSLIRSLCFGQIPEQSESQSDINPSPSASYQYALHPLQDATRSSDDLTEAQRWAWIIAQRRAGLECDRFLPKIDEIAGEELFSLGQLCMLGDNPTATRESIVRYLNSPSPVSRKQAILLLARAEVKLGTITTAVHHAEQLLKEFGYDNDSDELISYVIDGAEAREVTLSLGLEVAERRMPFLLEIIGQLKLTDPPQGNSMFSMVRLLQDGLATCELYRETDQYQKEQECFEKMKGFAQRNDRFKGTYDSQLMENAVKRFSAVGSRVKLRTMSTAALLSNGRMQKTKIPLQSGRVVLFIFSLASPSSSQCWSDLHALVRHGSSEPAKVYAITTYDLNGGGDPAMRDEVIQGLKQFRARLMPISSIYIVQDSELQEFRLDSYPSIIAISEGQIGFCAPFRHSIGTFGRFRRSLFRSKNQP